MLDAVFLSVTVFVFVFVSVDVSLFAFLQKLHAITSPTKTQQTAITMHAIIIVNETSLSESDESVANSSSCVSSVSPLSSSSTCWPSSMGLCVGWSLLTTVKVGALVVGRTDGVAVGAYNGETDGNVDGCLLGDAVGGVIGESVGDVDGCLLGDAVSDTVDGLFVGDTDGLLLGEVDG